MSFKLFVASTFGLIKSTTKLENAHKALVVDYQMFCEFEKAKELKEYNELDLLVNSPTFKQKKKELQGLSLKSSKEEAQLKELAKLDRNSKLRKFYATEKSEDLKKYEKVKASDLPEKFRKIKETVESVSFDKAKKKDASSKEYAQFAEFQNLKNSADLQFFQRYGKSPAYRNYVQMKDSPERKRLEELQQITTSAEFKARVTYLEDKQKWEKTADAGAEKRFTEMQKMPELVNYLKYKNSNAFEFFKKWELVFEDNFESGKLDREKWSTQSHWASKTLGQNFSQIGDLQAITDGKNISVAGKSMKIEVRKEKATGMQWQVPFGFVEREFDYTSGIVSTAGGDWWNHGILEAKVKYNPSASIVDAIYLLGEESSPQINLVEMGAKNRLGTLTGTENGVKADCESISGLKAGEFYIFRLEWTASSLVWKVNEREILTINLHVPSHTMHLNAASIVVSEPTGNLPHQFEIDWVRFYRHHNA
ncbi:MAG: glycoside hydrolase family 16 protein [Prolixibacteraceae bacterium]|jgi:beta-glucanase (GH16 family)